MLGLAFTMTNVQSFAAVGTPAWSLPWLAAWLLDPMVSLVLLAILRAEQVIVRYDVHAGGWVRGAKWFTLAATYVMNTWEALASGSADMVVLHSVPPLVVFVAVEAITELRVKLGEAAAVAAMSESEESSASPAQPVPERAESSPRRRLPASKARTSFEEYLSRARDAWHPGVQITPAWIRENTGCSRGLSSRLAAALTDEVSESEEHQ